MPEGMTRADHMRWCKQRAKDEINFTKNPQDGIISMMSDLRKHPDTRQESFQVLCMMTLMQKPSMGETLKFIDGFAE